MTLITWSVILKVIQLLKQILKKNELNEIKKVEIKGKRLIENQKKLLSLFDDLKTISNVNENENESESESESESVNENGNGNENENENERVNEN